MATRGEEGEEEEKKPVTGGPSPPAQRYFYLDWMRMIAIYLVVIFHCIQGLEVAGCWDKSHQHAVVSYRSMCYQTGMPIFLNIAGRARALARTEAIWQVIKRRFLRLGVPLLIGYVFLIVPLWQFAYLPYETPGMPKRFLPWLAYFLQPGHFMFTLSWLWLLPVLFFVEVFSLPVILYAETGDLSYLAGAAGLGAVVVGLLVPVCGMDLIVPIQVMTPSAVALALVHMVGLPPSRGPPLARWRPGHWLASQVLTAIQVAAHIALVCSFQYTTLFQDNIFGQKDPKFVESFKFIPGALLYFGFYQHAYFTQRWAQEPLDLPGEGDDEADSRLAGARLWNVLVTGLCFSTLALGANVGEDETGVFPVYSASFMHAPLYGAVSIAGTWAFNSIVTPLARFVCGEEVHPWLYKHGTGSVLVVYIFHYALIHPFVFWVIKDYGLVGGPWVVLAPLMTFTFAVCGSLGAYAALVHVPCLGALFGVA